MQENGNSVNEFELAADRRIDPRRAKLPGFFAGMAFYAKNRALQGFRQSAFTEVNTVSLLAATAFTCASLYRDELILLFTLWARICLLVNCQRSCQCVLRFGKDADLR